MKFTSEAAKAANKLRGKGTVRNTLYKAVVTFEYLDRPPDTVRTDIAAKSTPQAASRALKHARRTYPGKHICSLVIFLEQVRP